MRREGLRKPSAPKVVILCGGFGTRLREETEIKPKPMVEIGGKPILWHIMKTYGRYGYTDFVLCLGYKGDVIKHYFFNYEFLNNDFSINLGSGRVQIHLTSNEADWDVTLVDTGHNAQTGARVKRAQKYIDSDLFMLTYGDGVTDLNICDLVEFHRAHGKIATVTGVSPPSRYGELLIQEDRVTGFHEKPRINGTQISGGYFVFWREFLDYLRAEDGCVLEREPLERLSAEGQLMVYSHRGFWQCMDTYRDLEYLKGLWATGEAPWRVL